MRITAMTAKGKSGILFLLATHSQGLPMMSRLTLEASSRQQSGSVSMDQSDYSPTVRSRTNGLVAQSPGRRREAWLEHSTDNREVKGSNPFQPIHCSEENQGKIMSCHPFPTTSSIKPYPLIGWRWWLRARLSGT